MKGMDGYSRSSVRKMMPPQLRRLMENFDHAEESESSEQLQQAAQAISAFVRKHMVRDSRIISMVELDLAPRLEYAGDIANRAIQSALFDLPFADVQATDQYKSSCTYTDGEAFDMTWQRGEQFSLQTRHDAEVKKRVERQR